MRAFAGMTLLALLCTPVFAQSAATQTPATQPAATQPPATQTPGPPPAFEIADVRVSPHRTFPFPDGGHLRGDRYILRQATMVDLIAAAYGVEASTVQGGPIWLETDRFDIVAKAPPTTPPATVKLMLQSLLAERFNLVTQTGSKPMPAYVLSAGKGKPKLKESDAATEAGCEYQPPPPNLPPGTISNIVFACHNITMETFAKNLHDWAGGYLSNPVVDSTGLKGGWDFDIKWTGRGQLQKAGADGISIFDAVDKQLGLKLDLQTAPRPVLIVDSVNQKPTANPPGIEKSLPPPPAPEFDVATIKPSKPDTHLRGNIKGGTVDLQGATLKFMMTFAWDLNPNDSEVLVNAPKWLDSDHFDILAKVSNDALGPASATGSPRITQEDLQMMLRALLIERFKIQAHMEDRPISAYTLLAANPKLRPADPLSRTRCTEGPGPDGKDPRIASPVLNRLVTCQNMTMAQIGNELQHVASGYIYGPVLDSTGIKGSWDFTLSFSSADQILPAAATKPAASPDGTTTATVADPNGALSLFDAVNKQLGLKLEKQRRPAPVLVIDHIEEAPTEN